MTVEVVISVPSVIPESDEPQVTGIQVILRSVWINHGVQDEWLDVMDIMDRGDPPDSPFWIPVTRLCSLYTASLFPLLLESPFFSAWDGDHRQGNMLQHITIWIVEPG